MSLSSQSACKGTIKYPLPLKDAFDEFVVSLAEPHPRSSKCHQLCKLGLSACCCWRRVGSDTTVSPFSRPFAL
eukprot:5424165-Amphidinium_carterae.1